MEALISEIDFTVSKCSFAEGIRNLPVLWKFYGRVVWVLSFPNCDLFFITLTVYAEMNAQTYFKEERQMNSTGELPTYTHATAYARNFLWENFVFLLRVKVHIEFLSIFCCCCKDMTNSRRENKQITERAIVKKIIATNGRQKLPTI